MKRDLTNSRTYLPPRVRVVDVFAEQAILSDSQMRFHSRMSVDEHENVNETTPTEGFWIEF
ncbi:MAG: hypothetical protein IJS20_02830 [Bacteroidales bacterium]|nr:hypothetical protein [Bacteroidales bacterium]MBQ7237705.1 hypothetical protein [Bacteroidales bacterium]